MIVMGIIGESGFRASQLIEQVTKLGVPSLSGANVSMRTGYIHAGQTE